MFIKNCIKSTLILVLMLQAPLIKADCVSDYTKKTVRCQKLKITPQGEFEWAIYPNISKECAERKCKNIEDISKCMRRTYNCLWVLE